MPACGYADIHYTASIVDQPAEKLIDPIISSNVGPGSAVPADYPGVVAPLRSAVVSWESPR